MSLSLLQAIKSFHGYVHTVCTEYTDGGKGVRSMLFSIMHNDIIRILLKIPYDENELFVSLYEMYVC